MADDTANSLIYRIVVDSSAAKKGSDESKKALQGIEEQSTLTAAALARIEESFSSVTGRITEMVAAYITIDKAIEAIRSITEQIDKLSSTAATLGVSTAFLIGFQTAAASTSVKVDAAD